MNKLLHDQLNKLRIIGNLRVGQKLDTTKDLNVYDESYINWFYRKYHRDSKQETIRILQDIYVGIGQTTEQLIVELKNIKTEIKKNIKLEILVNVAEKIYDSILGIENLSNTYSDFPKTVACLEGVVQDYAIYTYKQIIHNIPSDKLSVKLKSNISYKGIILYKGKDSPEEKDSAESDTEI
jgi:hypothetical protein